MGPYTVRKRRIFLKKIKKVRGRKTKRRFDFAEGDGEEAEVDGGAACGDRRAAAIASNAVVRFCERINSCASAVVTEGNTLLSDDEMELLVMLRVNKGFMEFMQTHYPHVARETFSLGTILTVEDNQEDDDPEDDDTW